MGVAFLEGQTGGKKPVGTKATFIAKDQLKVGDVVYTVEGDIMTDIYYSIFDSNVNSTSFSPDGNTLVVGGLFESRAKIYSVSGTTVTYVSDIYADSGTTPLSSSVSSTSFSPDGTKLVLGGAFEGKAKVYSVSGTTVTFVSDIYADSGTTPLDSTVNSISFSPDGSKLVLGGSFTGRAKIYSVSGTTITYISDIYADSGTTALSSHVYSCSFSPDGTKLVVGGYFTGRAKIYIVSGTTVTYVSDIYANTGTTALSSTVYSTSFSPNGSKLVLGGGFTGRAKIYSVSGTTVTYVSDIYADSGTTVLSNNVNSTSFSPDGSKLVLGGGFTGRAKIYSVSGTTVAYISDIYSYYGTPALNNTVYSTSFSPDGNALVLGGSFTGIAKTYSVSGTTVAFTSYIYADTGTTVLNSTVYATSFSPDGSLLVIGGSFSGASKVYSVSGTTVTYVSDIYADAGTTALSSYVELTSFSPDGTKLVLAGNFTGKAKIYSVSGTTVTYISDIYADSGTTVLSSVKSISFSPDSNILVLGGGYAGRTRVYSVSGTTVSYTSDIYADSGTTALDSVYSIYFSPDGTKLVVGGSFTGRAKIYSVSGTTITYVSDIYADTGTTALSNIVYDTPFSPDGTKLVVAGQFTERAKIYSVSGTTVTYVSDIYADSGTTVFDDSVTSVVFSPDGSLLVLGGLFSGYGKVYSVSGTTITYISDIYSDSGTTPLDMYGSVQSASFSSDGLLVLGGQFSGYAKIYSISGMNVEYVNYAYKVSSFTKVFPVYPRFYQLGVGYSTKNVDIGEEVIVMSLI